MKVTFFFTSTKVGFQLPNIGYVTGYNLNCWWNLVKISIVIQGRKAVIVLWKIKSKFDVIGFLQVSRLNASYDCWKLGNWCFTKDRRQSPYDQLAPYFFDTYHFNVHTYKLKVTPFLLRRCGGISYPKGMRRLNWGQHCLGMSFRSRCLDIPGPSKIRPNRPPSPQHNKVR